MPTPSALYLLNFRPSMSFAVRLSTDLISVEAGATMPLSVEVVNRSEQADRFELEVEGLDPEWTAVPVPMFPVGTGDTVTEKVFFRTPRTPESQSGNYPFVVKVRSLTTGEQRTVQGVLQVQPYHHITAEISPKKGVVASFKRRNTFTLTLINMGNVEHTVQLFGSDPDEVLAFTFDQDHVNLPPGKQKEVRMTVNPTKRKLLWNVELHGFSITARSVDTPSVAAVTQAQLEAQPAVKASALILAALVLGIGWLWWYAQPRPPTFVMGLSKSSVLNGETVSIWWQLTNADRVHITVNGEMLYDDVVSEGNGRISYKAEGDKPVRIEGYAIGKDHQSPLQQLTLNVIVPPPAPLPKIVKFTASATKVRVGESVIFSYKLNEAVTKAFLSPSNLDLNLNADRIEIPITEQGTKEFTLIAENRDGRADQKTIKISSERVSEVQVISFTVTPKDLMDPGGLVDVSWQISNAVHVEITPNANINTNEVDPVKGRFSYYLDKSTTFTLVAKDKNNLPVTQTVRVTVAPPAPSTTSAGTPPFDGAGGQG
jgi:hypothetical protein